MGCLRPQGFLRRGTFARSRRGRSADIIDCAELSLSPRVPQHLRGMHNAVGGNAWASLNRKAN